MLAATERNIHMYTLLDGDFRSQFLSLVDFSKSA